MATRNNGNGRIDADKVKLAARGRELEILENVACIPRDKLDKRGHACPKCGGSDRFSLIDADAGAVLCRKCFSSGNGDFLAAVQWSLGVDFNEACRRVAKYLRIDGEDSPSRKDKPTKPSGSTSKSFPTAAAAVAALEAKHGPRAASWTYHDADDKPVGAIVRWDLPDGGKDIRPVSRHGDGWHAKGMIEPRPLYRLPSIKAAEMVVVVEGEKSADAAVGLGYVATTSPHGSASAAKADWQPLAGKQVVIVPDADEPGAKYAEQVARIVSSLTPPAEVRIVELPGLADKEDIVEWIAAGGTAEQLQALNDKSARWQPAEEPGTRPPDRIEPFVSFPLHLLPEPIRSYVDEAAAALGTDPSFIALPMLAALGSAVGNTRRIVLKSSWREPPILWTAIVGDSGTLKTPSLTAATDRLEFIQNKHLAEHQAALELFATDQLTHEAELAAWKKNTKGVRGDPPEAPQTPILHRVIVSETTVEALGDRLQHAPRGLLLCRDELAGWLQSFGAYKGGKGGDVAHWLSMYNAKPLRIDRKTGVTFTFVPSAAVSIAGGIQPETLKRCLSSEHFENGLAARMLLAMPPKRPRVWTEDTIDERLKRQVADLFDALLALDFTTDEDGNQVAVDVRLDRQAKHVWIDFYNRHGAEQAGLMGKDAALWSKLEGVAPRLALILHLVRVAAGDPTAKPEAIDETSMTAGAALADWFGHEAKRVYAALSETDEQRDERQLVDLIRRQGGWMTARELMRRCRKYGKADDAEAALESLVNGKFGRWDVDIHDAQGGRPVRRFQLHITADADRTPVTPTKKEVVSLSAASEVVKFTPADVADADENEVVEWTA